MHDHLMHKGSRLLKIVSNKYQVRNKGQWLVETAMESRIWRWGEGWKFYPAQNPGDWGSTPHWGWGQGGHSAGEVPLEPLEGPNQEPALNLLEARAYTPCSPTKQQQLWSSRIEADWEYCCMGINEQVSLYSRRHTKAYIEVWLL